MRDQEHGLGWNGGCGCDRGEMGFCCRESPKGNVTPYFSQHSLYPHRSHLACPTAHPLSLPALKAAATPSAMSRGVGRMRHRS